MCEVVLKYMMGIITQVTCLMQNLCRIKKFHCHNFFFIFFLYTYDHSAVSFVQEIFV